MNEEIYDNLRDKLNAFTDLARSYGYENFDSVFDDMKLFESIDPRRICKHCDKHIHDRFYDICTKCGKSFHKGCFDSHICN